MLSPGLLDLLRDYWGDVDGDNKADFTIKIAAGLDLWSADFLL